jgi:hypothetical protein
MDQLFEPYSKLGHIYTPKVPRTPVNTFASSPSSSFSIPFLFILSPPPLVPVPLVSRRSFLCTSQWGFALYRGGTLFGVLNQVRPRHNNQRAHLGRTPVRPRSNFRLRPSHWWGFLLCSGLSSSVRNSVSYDDSRFVEA